MSGEPGLADKVRLVHEALEDARVPHAFGGALALAYYGEPRLTIDIDVNVFVGPARLAVVLASLAPLGVDVSAVEDGAPDGQLRVWWGHNPIDLFFSYDPFHDAMKRATRSEPFGEIRIPILAPEHLIVCKAAFDRPKDWIDIEQMLVGVQALDREELETWLGRVLGEDSRVERVRELWGSTR